MNTNLPGIGDNISAIDYAGEETARLNQDYASHVLNTDALLAEAAAFEVVESPDTKSKVMSLIKRIRDQAKALAGLHELEKMPHYRRGQADDQFFFGMIDKLAKRDRRARDGEADRLNGLLTAYDVRELEKERERRRLALEEEQRKLREAEKARLQAEQEAEQARLAAERARKPETQAAKEEIAQQAAEVASDARVETAVAQQAAEVAYVDTLATPADIMRTRTADGTLGTMGTEDFAEITNRAELDLEKLRPYFTMDALDKAVRAYAKANAYSSDASVQIKGARFGKRAKSRVR